MTARIKHPRIPHLPWSPGATDDDTRIVDLNPFMSSSRIVVTEKLDGENTTLYRDGYLHARSTMYSPHPSRDWLRAFHGRFAHEIPEGFRICGENLFARHSIGYDRLPSYFLVHSIWDHRVCLSWDSTLEWCRLLGLDHVPVLFELDGFYGRDQRLREGPVQSAFGAEGAEGFVLRDAGEIGFAEYGFFVAKWVRPHHVQTNDHWMHSAIIPNGLASVLASAKETS